MEAAKHITIENGLLLQITLRLDVFKYHGRKFRIAKAFSMDSKKPSSDSTGKVDDNPVPLLPGFLHLNEWFCTERIQQGLGILNDQHLPKFQQPTPGGEWKVRWEEYIADSSLQRY